MGKLDVLALLPPSSREGATEAAGRLGWRLELVSTVDDLLSGLREAPRGATVVSFTPDPVDRALIERISKERSVGALLLTVRHSSLATALFAERVGAVALLEEPLCGEALIEQLESITGEGAQVPLQNPDQAGPARLLGDSRAMAEVFRLIAKAAGSSSTVLITGESGTGKEVVARTLHEEGDRRHAPFVAVNCAAIPEHLLESELFGHEKGSFTGAVGRRTGRFERANGGTLFLDEIGDMSLVLQAKVLRALEERSVEAVGANQPRPIDVRLVAATNHSLPVAIAEGRFREDLYYRLGVVEIDLPPLRERLGDVRTLALHFAAHFAQHHRREITAITEKALDRLQREAWPGNVRELRNVMDRAVLLTAADVIQTGALRVGAGSPRRSADPSYSDSHGYPEGASLAEVEADHIRRVLAAVDGQMGRAAHVLGIHRNTLTRKVHDYGLFADTTPSEAP